MTWVYDDGGRAEAGFRGDAGDCVTRAIAICTGLPYREVYDELFDSARQTRSIPRGKASPRSGVQARIYRDPQAQIRKGARNPAGERVKAAGASLGRVLCGGHPDHRTYLAFLQALYVVTTQQDYDVAARIEMLWDQMAYDEEPEAEGTELPTRGWITRLLDRIAQWFRQGWAV